MGAAAQQEGDGQDREFNDNAHTQNPIVACQCGYAASLTMNRCYLIEGDDE